MTLIIHGDLVSVATHGLTLTTTLDRERSLKDRYRKSFLPLAMRLQV